MVEFQKGASGIRRHADVFLVATVKNPKYLRFSSLEAARILQDSLKVEASPTIVVRDANRFEVLSSIISSFAVGLDTIALVWGDNYPQEVGSTNVRDFTSLSEAIGDAVGIARRSRVKARIFAPVDLSKLDTPEGSRLARARLEAGAQLLLAQPPTTDGGETFEKHQSLLERTGLADKVILNVFPFRSAEDLGFCERYFGWKLPDSLRKTAERGKAALLEEAEEVATKIKAQGLPGVYLSTRGEPDIAGKILRRTRRA